MVSHIFEQKPLFFFSRMLSSRLVLTGSMFPYSDEKRLCVTCVICHTSSIYLGGGDKNAL